jgi:three-Cys-motif partner protein
MNSNFHKNPFDEATKLKLEIFSECFKEWLPVFIFNHAINKIFIYDFFAGSGHDSEGYPGSPLKLLNEAKGEGCKVCNSLNKKEIIFAFNDKNKSNELQKAVDDYMYKCLLTNCKKESCNYKPFIAKYDFKEAFERENVKQILKNKKYAKFILLDQFGFSQVDEGVFKQLTNAETTDFIFFIASSFIDRFKDTVQTKKYFDTSKIDFMKKRPVERHELIAKYFEQLIEKEEYYIHHFTIKKGTNYYGLIFGTGHTYGMEKFLKVCWEKDEFSGESNSNKHVDHEKNTLFYNPENSNKKESVKNDLKLKIFNMEITDNLEGLKYVLKKGCLPKLFTETIVELEKSKQILRIGAVNNQSTKIHTARKYQIEIL